MSLPLFIEHIWIVPALPLLGAAIARLAARKFGNVAGAWISAVGIALSFLCGLAALLELVALPLGERVAERIVFNWIPGIGVHVQGSGVDHVWLGFGFLLDPLSAVMVVLVAGMAVLIHACAIGYANLPERHLRAFACFDVCVASMLLIVLSNNLAVLLAGWMGLSASTYLLILFSSPKPSSSEAPSKAFLLNYVADATLLLATIIVSFALGTTRFAEIQHAIASANSNGIRASIAAAAFLLIFAAVTKAAQFPFHIWLPDAAEYAPAGALIQSVTVLPAAVFLLIRMNGVLQVAPGAMEMLVLIGAVTVLFAASVAIVEDSLVRCIAWLTLSQFGFLFVACGLGALSSVPFHLLTHGVFKTTLIAAAGAAIQAEPADSDIRRIVSTQQFRFPYWAMLIGAFGLCAIFPFAGFSQDFGVSASKGAQLILVSFGCFLAGVTAFCMTRIFALTFYVPGADSGEVEQTLGLSRWASTPLTGLAAISLVTYVAWPRMAVTFERFVALATESSAVVLRTTTEATPSVVHAMLFSEVFVVIGILASGYLYIKRPYLPNKIATRCARVHDLLSHRYYVDEFYDSIVVAPTQQLSLALRKFDSAVVDGVVNGIVRVAQLISGMLLRFDDVTIDRPIGIGARFVRLASFPVRMLQTGFVQTYMLLAVAGIMGFLGYYMYVLLHSH